MTFPPRIAFFGTPAFAVPALEALAAEAQVVLVVTQPDRPAGRGQKTEISPVKASAARLGIDLIQPDIVKGSRFAERVRSYAPDFIVTAAFGRLLGPSLLRVPARDSLNIHASLLPRHRGAAPINWAILAGDRETGVSIMRMEEALDTGPVFVSARTAIRPRETAGELSDRLARLGAEAILDTLRRYDSITPTPQDPLAATYARMLEKSDGAVDWARDAEALSRHVRGMSPWPSATTLLLGRLLKLHAAYAVSPESTDGPPGTVLAVSAEGIDVACSPGVLRITELQAAGRKRLKAAEFLAGAPLRVGTALGV